MNNPRDSSADGRRRDSGDQWDLSLTTSDLRDRRTKVPLAEPAKPKEGSPFISNHKPRRNRNQKHETDTNPIQDNQRLSAVSIDSRIRHHPDQHPKQREHAGGLRL